MNIIELDDIIDKHRNSITISYCIYDEDMVIIKVTCYTSNKCPITIGKVYTLNAFKKMSKECVEKDISEMIKTTWKKVTKLH